MYNNYKIIKELNKGYSGIAYLIEKDDKKYVLKRQKLLPKEVKLNYKYSIWREIDFNKFVNKLSKSKQKYFMKMYDYKINECDYQHKPKVLYINPMMKKDLIARNKSKYCLDIVIEYKGNTIYNLIKNGLPVKEKYCLIIQVLYALDIMHSNKYLHQDIHQGNITYEKANNPIKVYGKTLPCEYQYSLIDYGATLHKKFNETKDEMNYYTKEKKRNSDVNQLMINIILQEYMLNYIYEEKKWKPVRWYEPKTYGKIMKTFYNNKPIWNKIKKILYKTNKLWFDNYEKTYDFTDCSACEYIEILFSAYNRKEFLKIKGWTKIYIPNFIHSDDIIFMVENMTDNKKMIKYFLKNLND